MPHLGSRENPAEILEPGGLERAVARVWHPTPEQATAGNYKMAHVIVGGLHLTIETPKDRMRCGVGPDGTSWSVRMPASYGYVKGTEGSDGDAVDVYVGPEAHRADKLSVWIVDQIDADELTFDEHKAMLGFLEPHHARETYFGAFSDGRGKDRVGAVVRMTFPEFCQWLKSGNTKKPLAYRNPKSASVVGKANHYCPPTCSCRSPQEKYGDTMTTEKAGALGTTALNSPTGLGRLMGTISKALGRMTPDERASLMADAQVSAGIELGKASDLLSHGDDGGTPGRVEDQWDGAPDDALEVGGGSGPDSTAAPGKVNVGPAQSASGNGAMPMERHYSRFSPQSGVQAATEKLGRDLVGLRSAMKSFLRAFEANNMQLETIKANIAAASAQPDIAALVDTAVAKAIETAIAGIGVTVAKAVRKEVSAAVAKAKIVAKGEDESGEEDEGEDDEAKESESGGETEVEISNEVDDEAESDEDEDEKAAAKARLAAKSRIKWASKRLIKAIEFVEDGKPGSCAIQYGLAKANLAKARVYLEVAKSAVNQPGPKTTAVAKAIAKVEKAIKAAPVDNQKNWPASTDKQIGKAVEGVTPSAAAAGNGVSKADLENAMAAINKAVEGTGMLQAKVGEMFAAISGQSRTVAPGGQVLPPTFSLAKSMDDLTSKEAEIIKMAQDSLIRPMDVDGARDVISNIRTNLPEAMIKAKIARLPQPVQDVILRQAA
jgi:hypothetical protein